MFKKRSTDEWLHKRKRWSNYFWGGLASVCLAGALFVGGVAVHHSADVRKDMILLMCDPKLIREFGQPPTDVRGELRRLWIIRTDKCTKLLKQEGLYNGEEIE